MSVSLIKIFSLIALGFFCKQKGMFSTKQIEGFEIFLLKIALPCYLFTSIGRYSLSELLYPPFIMGYLLSFLAILAIVAIHTKKPAGDILIRTFSAGYINTAIYMIPIVTFIYHNPSSGVLSNLTQVLCIQPLMLILLQWCHPGPVLKKIIKPLKTPVIVLPLIAVVVQYLNLSLPLAISHTLQQLGDITSGLALFTFGLSIAPHSTLIKNPKGIQWPSKAVLELVCIKTLIHPFFSFLIGYYLCHLSGYWLVSLVIAGSAPTAFLAYLIAKDHDIKVQETKQVLALSSVIALLVLLCIVFIFNPSRSLF